MAHEDNLKPVQGHPQQQEGWIRQRLWEGIAPAPFTETYQFPPNSNEKHIIGTGGTSPNVTPPPTDSLPLLVLDLTVPGALSAASAPTPFSVIFGASGG